MVHFVPQMLQYEHTEKRCGGGALRVGMAAMTDAAEQVQVQAYLMDMDGVLVRGTALIPGADEFIARLRERGLPFLILTNNSTYTPRDLQVRLERLGLYVRPEELFTSALATAQFLRSQSPGGTAFVIGESGLTTALHDIGYVLTDFQPGYVVVGETASYNYQRLAQAVRLVAAGARFIFLRQKTSPFEGWECMALWQALCSTPCLPQGLRESTLVEVASGHDMTV